MKKKNQMAALKNLNHMKLNLTTPYGFDFHIFNRLFFLHSSIKIVYLKYAQCESCELVLLGAKLGLQTLRETAPKRQGGKVSIDVILVKGECMQ